MVGVTSLFRVLVLIKLTLLKILSQSAFECGSEITFKTNLDKGPRTNLMENRSRWIWLKLWKFVVYVILMKSSHCTNLIH